MCTPGNSIKYQGEIASIVPHRTPLFLPTFILPFHQQKRTITMKGPWESIAAGREKGFKTEKLEKVENHATKRVRSVGRMFM